MQQDFSQMSCEQTKAQVWLELTEEEKNTVLDREITLIYR